MEWGREAFERYYRFRPERLLGGRFTPNGQSPRPYIYVHYHDFFVGKFYRTTGAQAYYKLLGLRPGDSVVLMGGGFNWTGEGLEALGVQCIAADTSAYIINAKNDTEESELRECFARAGVDSDTHLIPDTEDMRQKGLAGKNMLDHTIRGSLIAPKSRGFGEIAAEDASTNASVNSLARLVRTKPRWILSEEMLNSLDDQTAILALEAIERLRKNKFPEAQVAHALSPLQEGSIQAPELNWKSYSGWRVFLDSNGCADHKIIPTVTYGGVETYGGLL